jgi:predicted outer membrane repeat protein
MNSLWRARILRWCQFSALVFVASLQGCGGGGGSGNDSDGASSPPTVGLQSSAADAKINFPVTISWTASNGSTCTASGAWSGSKASSGSEEVIIGVEGSNAYTLTCRNSANQSQAKTVTVIGQPVCEHASTADGTLVSSVDELREALSVLGGNGVDDKVYLAAGLYRPQTTIVYDAMGSTEKVSLVGCAAEDVEFDGQGLTRIFHFQKNGEIGDAAAWQMSTIGNPPYPKLRLENMTIRNGDSGSDSHKWGYSGGAMLVERYDTELDRMRLINNREANEGGAVNGVADVTISNSTFLNNTSGMGGGAISACGAVSVTNSTFESNSRLSLYRGICIQADYSRLPITIEGSNFLENQTAIYVLGGYGAPSNSFGQLTIANSVFDSNTEHAVVTRLGNVTITNSLFLNNGFQTVDNSAAADCVDYDFYPCSNGGALFVDNWFIGGGVVTIEDSEFTGNYAPNYGGAIAMGGVRDCEQNFSREGAPCNPTVSGSNPEYNLILRNTIFKSNRSHRGAAIAIAKMPLAADGFQRGSVTIEGGAFAENVAELIEPRPGIVPVDELESSIIGAGGAVRTCGTTFSGNVADTEVAAKAGHVGC